MEFSSISSQWDSIPMPEVYQNWHEIVTVDSSLRTKEIMVCLKTLELSWATQETSLSLNKVQKENEKWWMKKNTKTKQVFPEIALSPSKKSSRNICKDIELMKHSDCYGTLWLLWIPCQWHSSYELPMISNQIQPTSNSGSSLTPMYAHHVKLIEALYVPISLHTHKNCRCTRGIITNCWKWLDLVWGSQK